MGDEKKQDNGKIEPRKRIPLTEPAPPPKTDGNRVRVNDGLDNSDLRTLIALAKKKAAEEK